MRRTSPPPRAARAGRTALPRLSGEGRREVSPGSGLAARDCSAACSDSCLCQPSPESRGKAVRPARAAWGGGDGRAARLTSRFTRTLPLVAALLALLAPTRAARAQTRSGSGAAGNEFRAAEREPYADAPGVTPIDQPTRATANSRDREILVSGFYRTRGDLGYNWDLNRGPTPSTGMLVWPAAYVDGGRSRWLANLDMRLRLDAEARIGYSVRIYGRLHALDNLRWGSTPDGDFPGAVLNQRSPLIPVDVRQLFAEVLLPFGVLRAGRMGAPIDWGTGFWVNSGNGLDDDFGDVGDRIMFAMPLLGLVWTAMYELSAGGPGTDSVRPEIRPALDLDPRDDVHTGAFSFARYDAPASRARKLAAGRTNVNFGVFASYRTQDYDLAPGAAPTQTNAIHRDLHAVAADAWLRVDIARFTLEAEFGYAYVYIGNASLDPNLMVNVPVTGNPFGGVLRADWRASPRFFARVEVGLASGDPSPGFGARPFGTAPAQPGDLDGPPLDLTASPPRTTINNFRFHPNYRIDLLLWRRLIGTVTDAVYARPMVRYRLAPMFTVEGAVVASAALEPSSTPGNASPLGVETDLSVIYEQEHGFVARLDYGFLVPLAGLRNAARDIDPSPAHALHLILAYRF